MRKDVFSRLTPRAERWLKAPLCYNLWYMVDFSMWSAFRHSVPARAAKDRKRLNYDKWIIPRGTTWGDRWWLLAVLVVKSKRETTAGEKHHNKVEFLCFSVIWLHRHTRPATLLSSLGMINEHALHGGREKLSNCFLFFYFGKVPFSMPWAFLPQIRNILDAKVINYGDMGFA